MKEYYRIARLSDAEFCSPGKIEGSRVGWGSNVRKSGVYFG